MKEWIQLIALAALCWLSVVHLAPAVRDLPLVDELCRRSRARGIDASGLFYSEVAAAVDAARTLHELRRKRAPR